MTKFHCAVLLLIVLIAGVNSLPQPLSEAGAAEPAKMDNSLDSGDSAIGSEKEKRADKKVTKTDAAPKDEPKRSPSGAEDMFFKRTDGGNAAVSIKNKRIIFGTTTTANRMPRKFPLVFCDLEKDSGIVCPGNHVGTFMESFYYDAASNQCQHFSYNGCGGNANRFSTLWECNTNCVKKNVATIKLYY